MSAPATTMPTPTRQGFNWAEASDSDSDNDNTTTLASHVVEAAPEATTPVVKAADASAAPSGANTATKGTRGDGVTPTRRCQEITIQAAIPYTLKSVWNPATANNSHHTPSRQSAAAAAAAAANANAASAATTAAVATSSSTPVAGNSPASSHASLVGASPTSMRTFSGAATPTVATVPRPVRMNRAVDELTSVLRQCSGKMPYDELMTKSQWRSRFQPSFGSLFTFLKRNRDIFHYQQSIVELKQEGTIVSELLKINWMAAAAANGAHVTASANKQQRAAAMAALAAATATTNMGGNGGGLSSAVAAAVAAAAAPAEGAAASIPQQPDFSS